MRTLSLSKAKGCRNCKVIFKVLYFLEEILRLHPFAGPFKYAGPEVDCTKYNQWVHLQKNVPKFEFTALTASIICKSYRNDVQNKFWDDWSSH